MDTSQRKPNYQGIGAPLRRVEDKRFLTGHGRFVADIDLPGALACALARETVRHVGEPVAAVVAAMLTQAVDAAERVEVDYAPLSAVTDARAAQAEVAPQLHACAPGNVCFRWARGDEAAVRAALRSAAHV